MIVLKLFRSYKLAIFLALLLLFVSCSQYDMDKTEKSFDYTIYNTLKHEKIMLDIPIEIISINSELKKRNEIINLINETYNTDLKIPQDLIFMPNEFESNKSKENYLNYLTENDKELYSIFANDFRENSFDFAMEAFEENVLSIENLSIEEFTKYNNFANIFRLIEKEKGLTANPLARYEINEEDEGIVACIIAIGMHMLATMGLTVCQPGTISTWPCIRATLAWAGSLYSVSQACENGQEL